MKQIPYVQGWIDTTLRDPVMKLKRYTVHSADRNPPRILIREADVRQSLVRHKLPDCLYQPHTIWFQNQDIIVSDPSFYLSPPTYLNVSYLWSSEYFHFLTEALPNALFLHDKYPGTPICVLKSTFAEAAFRWFGVQSPIVWECPKVCKQIMAAYVECGNPSKQKIDRLRRTIESRLSFEPTHGILIRRHGSRELLNEAEVLDVFRSKFPHLTWVVFDMLPFAETAELFSKAAMIVGPHGAGFTNMLFAPKGATLYEFMPVYDPNVCYWHLAEMLGHSYFMIPLPNDETGSMRCDIDELLEILERP